MKYLLVFVLLFACVESVRQISGKSTMQTDNAWVKADGPDLPDKAQSWFVPETTSNLNVFHAAVKREAGRYGQTHSWFLGAAEDALEGDADAVIGAIENAIANAGAPDDAAVMATKAAYACGQSFSQDWLNIYAETTDKPDDKLTNEEIAMTKARASKLEASNDQQLYGAFKRVLKLSANRVGRMHELSDCHIMINSETLNERLGGGKRVDVFVVDRKLYVPPTPDSGTKKYKACLVTTVTASPDLPLYPLPTHWFWQVVDSSKNTVQQAFHHWKGQATELPTNGPRMCWLETQARYAGHGIESHSGYSPLGGS